MNRLLFASMKRPVSANSYFAGVKHGLRHAVLLLMATVYVSVTAAPAVMAQAPAPTPPPSDGQTLEPLSEEDLLRLYRPFFDPNSEDAPETCGSNFSGSNNAHIAFNYLTSKGLNSVRAAGIVGNLMAESGPGVDPKAVSRSGYTGIAQWDKAIRWPRVVSWAESNKRDPFDLQTQLDYMWMDAEQRGNIAGINAYNDEQHAAWYWGRFYEVAIIGSSRSETPLTNVQKLDKRIEYALSVSKEYGGSTGESAGGDVSCAGSLGSVECPANIEAHPSQKGYFKMPDAPNGEYIIYSSTTRRYGSRELVCTLYSVGLAYNEAMGGKSQLRFGDLNAAGHKSHRWGVAVDLSGFGQVQAASHNKSWKGTYSKEATVLLGKLFVDSGMLRNIWWCPPAGDSSIQEILGYAAQKGGIEGQIKCVSGHQDHFHVDIKSQYRLQEWTP